MADEEDRSRHVKEDYPRHCERKRSNPCRKHSMDCFVASLLAMMGPEEMYNGVA
jgi:hypothetical protein